MEQGPVLAVVVAVAVVLIAVVIIRRGGKSVPTTSAPPVTAASLPAEVRARIDRLLLADSRIQAIKELRTATGASLVDAKNAIDAWQIGGADARPAPPAGADAGGFDAATVAEIDGLLAQGSTIQAIKVLRERTGWGLREAKERIDRWVPGRG